MRDWSLQFGEIGVPRSGVLQSLRMEGSNLFEFSKFCGGSYLYEFKKEGGSNPSEFSK